MIGSTRLEPVLIRIPPEMAAAMRALHQRTRVPASEYYREAVADLLRKRGALPSEQREGGNDGA